MAPATALTPESGPVAVTGASGFVGVRDGQDATLLAAYACRTVAPSTVHACRPPQIHNWC
eukprot:SAG31_NODE_13870_length_841_cov_0.997305_1_plen_59_part_10